MNQLRAAGADCHTGGTFARAAALTWSAQLTQSAEGLSQDMVANNFFSHTGSNGSTLSSRVNATSYAWSSLGENIAAGYPTLDAVMTGWMGSDGHCANLMNPAFNQVGLVCVPGTAANTYNTYWTMDLAHSP
ncbi:MAG: CAP domain-containing protein [Burkholderiales bacterium]